MIAFVPLFVGVLLTTEVTSTSEINDFFDYCCDLGRDWAVRSHELCGPYPVASGESLVAAAGGGGRASVLGGQETVLCSALVDSCCVLARRDSQCSAGKEVAAAQGTCSGLHQYQANEDVKECCNCCHLAIILSQISAECNIPAQLSLSLICVQSFTECCHVRRSPVSPASPDDPQTPRVTQRWTNGFHVFPPRPTTPATAFSIAATGIDICERFKDELCAHKCVANDNDDGYHCECHVGFSLQADGKTCSAQDSEIGIDEDRGERKVEEEDGIEGIGAGNRDGTSSQPEKCEDGFAWNRITHQCEDIDECILDLHNCASNQFCVNVDGNFQCEEEEEEEEDDRNTYDDDYPETNPPPTTTTTITTTTSRPTVRSRSRSREERPTFAASSPTPRTKAPRVPPPLPPGRRTTKRAKEEKEEEEEEEESIQIQCLFGFAPDDRNKNCVDVDECSSGAHNCRHPNQLCINTVGSHRCQCERGYTSNLETEFCEDVDECALSSVVCSEDQLCENTFGSYSCSCLAGFTIDARTKQCTDVNECRLTPSICSPEQECQNIPGSYRCTRRKLTCPLGYRPNLSGTQCIDVDECSPERSSCAVEKGQLCVNTPGSFHCRCQAGFSADATTEQCTDVDECSANENICGESETKKSCENTVGSYLCRCVSGYHLNASTSLCDDADECRSREFTCYRGQTCVNTPGSFECRCEAGFTLDPRNNECVDIDECRQNQRVCEENEICENIRGSFRCLQKTLSCPTGFAPDQSGRRCSDVDECQMGTDDCGIAWACYNTPGSFRCVLKQCPRGQRLDQETGQCTPVVCARGMRLDHAGTCTDINECVERSNTCRPHQVCRNTIGSYLCHNSVTCGSGYEINEDTGHCDDVDECLRGSHRCQGHGIQCVNQPGTYLCQCPQGYQLNQQRQSCEDADECRLYREHICSQDSRCENLPGSYRCICKEGFEMAEDKRSCRDVDECLLQPRFCQHNCHNAWGSFRCSCNNGFQLSSTDSRSCSDVDECRVSSPRGALLCQGICENTPGSYRCTCPPGYQMGSDGRNCRDVDECVGGGVCSRPEDVCINTRGGHRCENVVCPKGFTRILNSNKNSHAIRCQRQTFTCAQGDADCLYAPLSYSVNFVAIPGKLIRVPTALFTMRGPVTSNRRLQFELQVVSSLDPRTGAVDGANRTHFDLSQVKANEVVVQLVDEIRAPNDVQLRLKMDVFSRESDSQDETFFGTAVAKIFIYITEDPW